MLSLKAAAMLRNLCIWAINSTVDIMAGTKIDIMVNTKVDTKVDIKAGTK